jgi:hypothetical protein
MQKQDLYMVLFVAHCIIHASRMYDDTLIYLQDSTNPTNLFVQSPETPKLFFSKANNSNRISTSCNHHPPSPTPSANLCT